MTPEQNAAALQAALTAISVATGATPPVDGAKAILGYAVDMIPEEELKGFLLERDRIFADLAADVAEEIKLDGGE